MRFAQLVSPWRLTLIRPPVVNRHTSPGVVLLFHSMPRFPCSRSRTSFHRLGSGSRNLHQTLIEARWPVVPGDPEIGGVGVAGRGTLAAASKRIGSLVPSLSKVRPRRSVSSGLGGGAEFREKSTAASLWSGRRRSGGPIKRKSLPGHWPMTPEALKGATPKVTCMGSEDGSTQSARVRRGAPPLRSVKRPGIWSCRRRSPVAADDR